VANIVLITHEYFSDKENFVEMLDFGDRLKQSTRCYFSVATTYNGNSLFVPLRSVIDLSVGKMGYPLPSSSRPKAGLDFRKILIVNNVEHISILQHPNISSSQMTKLVGEVMRIESRAVDYVSGYVKSAKKRREKIDSKYRFSTLHNFHKELGI